MKHKGPNHPNIRLDAPTTHAWEPSGDPDRDIAVLMSGGVDSSVTAMILRDAGWNAVGITMRIPVAEGCGGKRPCCGLEAGYVARDLDIAHYYLDVRSDFERLVIEPFRRDYARGRTPSPCVDCNTLIKFWLVWNFIESRFGIRHLATGHYARLLRSDNDVYLARGDDHSRDQSYFLYGIPRNRLPFFHLPLGEMGKESVRRLAREAKLPVARRQDSMELCFAAEGDYRAVLGAESKPGPILDIAGAVIGEHEGIVNYTIGQRKGARVAAGKPLYVIRISAGDNSITLGTREQAESRDVLAEEVNVLIPELMRPGEKLRGKIRSQGEPAECEIIEAAESTTAVRFEEPQFAVTPGQRLVLYDAEDRVVSGGVIAETEHR
jgi:tRNA-uridine 2-sulfurtransferase